MTLLSPTNLELWIISHHAEVCLNLWQFLAKPASRDTGSGTPACLQPLSGKTMEICGRKSDWNEFHV